MTIRTANNAFRYFGLGLGDALGKGNIDSFNPSDVIEVQGSWITEAAISTANCAFIITEPFAEGRRACARCFAVARGALIFCTSVIVAPIFRVVRALSRPVLTTRRAVDSTFSLRCELSVAHRAAPEGRFDIHPGWHILTITHPCKPDIFMATYEAVSE